MILAFWLALAAALPPPTGHTASASADVVRQRGPDKAQLTGVAAIADMMARAEAGDVSGLSQASHRAAAPAVRALIRARLAASRLDDAAVDDALASYRQAAGRTPELDGLAFATQADSSFAAGRYAAASAAARRWLALPAGGDPIHKAEDIAQLEGIAAALAVAPAQSVVQRSSAEAPTFRDKVGLLRTTSLINGEPQQVVLDTGANVSVVSASAASRLKLRMLTGAGSVGSSTRQAVATRLGVADRVVIAGSTLKNVAFLVLDDAQLSPAPGYQIDAILGFPAFRALGAVAFDASGRFSAPNTRGLGREHPHNLLASGSNLFVQAEVNGMPVPLHLDSGSTVTTLSARFTQDHPALLEGAAATSSRYGGAGGTVERRTAALKLARVKVSGVVVTLPTLDVALGEEPGTSDSLFGVLGQDVLRSYAGYTIDFTNMSFQPFGANTKPPRPAREQASGRPAPAGAPKT